MSKIPSQQRGSGSLRNRQNFARIPQAIDIPNLIEIQKKSFERFIQGNVSPGDRKVQGLEEVFRDVFPIIDLNINARIEYIGYEVGIWECGGEEYGGLGGPGVICDETDMKSFTRKSISSESAVRKDGLMQTPLR